MHEDNLPPDSPLAERLKHSSADGCLDAEIRLARLARRHWPRKATSAPCRFARSLAGSSKEIKNWQSNRTPFSPANNWTRSSDGWRRF